jgi:murein DD-endopeptidase MepM/ murein hydrolase activator NlpD
MSKQKRFAMILAVVLAALLIVPFVISMFTGASAAPSSKELERLKENAKVFKSEKARLVNELTSVRATRQDAIAEKEALDQQISVVEQEIENTTLLIAEYAKQIAEVQAELDAAQVVENEQLELFLKRVRVMEETSDASYLGILLGADSYQDLLGRMSMINEIMDYDQQIIDNLRQTKEKIAATKADLEAGKAEQREVKRELAEQQAELVAQYELSNSFIKTLEADEIAYRRAYDEAEKQEKEAQEEIKKVQAEIEAALAAAKKARSVYVGGDYAWPLPGYAPGNRRFGTQPHPILKVNRMHSGWDVGAPTGVNVLSANSGKVIIAKRNSGYGNYVVVDHGGGNATLYAHLSKISVSVGQSVSKGDVLGKVGSTGLSTGPHLHFEIHKDGAAVNPANYFSVR